MPEFGSLESQEVRSYWEHEADDFTPWLASEIRGDPVSKLEEALELDLAVLEEEKSVGRYNVDIFAEVVDDNRKVIIENQLESSDHDHLGKSIAYASGVDADIIVWIAPRFYDEHRDAMQWLNENSREGVDLFAIRLEVWRIGNSEPAVRLNPIAEPSEWKEKAKRSEHELSDTETLREEYWTAFRDRIEEENSVLSARKPFPDYYYNNPIGKAGVELQFTIKATENEIGVALVIRDDADLYRYLADDRDVIDSQLEQGVMWEEPEETRAGNARSNITVSKNVDVWDEARWEEYTEWMLQTGEQFHDVFYDRLQKY
jgi:hypothetical protein